MHVQAESAAAAHAFQRSGAVSLADVDQIADLRVGGAHVGADIGRSAGVAGERELCAQSGSRGGGGEFVGTDLRGRHAQVQSGNGYRLGQTLAADVEVD